MTFTEAATAKEAVLNTEPKTQNRPEDSDAELPSLWKIQDPFQYAPPKPDEDPWTLLLKPLLKNDKMRCDAWTDEVQNLLIFAGLFSGVVTAFVIESYKNLQPDPNDAMINLLAHIATRLDGQSNFTNITTAFQLPEEFSASASAIRVNVFWFISLVLSLTTVLVGIISLQWLREHQSYSNLSPREAYAVFNMRAEGLKKWQVDNIFTALPLLLQCALILFLGGIIDFLHAFRQWAVVIPVAAVIGLTLVFLVATTVIPTLQTFFLYIPSSSGGKSYFSGRPTEATPPDQCPYKSPQSHAVRTLFRPLFALSHYLYRRLQRYSLQSFWFRITRPFSRAPPYWYSQENFPVYLYYSSFSSTWVDFDKSWLTIRDAYMRRALGRLTWYESIGYRSHNIPPILDIVVALDNQKCDKSLSAAAYHCLSTVSEAALLPLHRQDLIFQTPADRLRQNDYLYDLLSPVPGCSSLSDFLDLDACFEEAAKGDSGPTKTLSCILHQQNLLASIDNRDGLSTHRKELALRLFGHFYQGRHEMRFSASEPKLPDCLTFRSFDQSYPRSKDPDLCDDDLFEVLAWQVSNLTSSIFRQFDGQFHPHSLVYNSFAQNVGLPFFMEVASYVSLKALSLPPTDQNPRPCRSILPAATDTFRDIFAFINQSLSDELSSWSESSAEGQPSLLFYLTTCFVHQLSRTKLNMEASLNPLLDSIREYKNAL